MVKVMGDYTVFFGIVCFSVDSAFSVKSGHGGNSVFFGKVFFD